MGGRSVVRGQLAPEFHKRGCPSMRIYPNPAETLEPESLGRLTGTTAIVEDNLTRMKQLGFEL